MYTSVGTSFGQTPQVPEVLSAVFYTTKYGSTGVAMVTTSDHCGSIFGLQQMLHQLGFYTGAIDGLASGQLSGSVAAFAASRGILYNPLEPARGQICRELVRAYVEKHGQAPPAEPSACLPGQWGVHPLCVGEPTVPSAAPGQCPAGTLGQQPHCFPYPSALPGTAPVQPASPSASACPAGSVGIPPHCYGVPGAQPSAPVPAGIPACPAGQVGVPPHCYSVPGGVPAPLAPLPPLPPPGSPAASTGWWGARSTPERMLIGTGAAVAAVLLAATAVKAGKKKKPKAKTPAKRPAAMRGPTPKTVAQKPLFAKNARRKRL